MASFSSVPDNIILEILSYLPLKDLCICGRVNRRWRRIVRDNSLWRHVDLTPYRLDLNKMWKVIRAHFSDCLLSMKIKGFLSTGGPKQKKYSISDAMLNDLSERCPNIKTFHLNQCNTDNLDCQKLPTTLTSLAICNSIWQPGWFKQKDDKPVLLPNLKHLNLSGSSRVDNFDVKDFKQWPELETLELNNCYRISEEGLNFIAFNLPKLKVLEISGTLLSELSMHHISRNLKNLTCLNISRCEDVSDSFLEEIASSLVNLNWLNVCSCTKVTEKGIEILQSNENLTIFGNQ